MVAVSRTRTKRILRAPCLFCGAELYFELEDFVDSAEAQAWFDDLPIEAWEFIRDEHGCETATQIANCPIQHPF
jgi:hypothetical protein